METSGFFFLTQEQVDEVAGATAAAADEHAQKGRLGAVVAQIWEFDADLVAGYYGYMPRKKAKRIRAIMREP